MLKHGMLHASWIDFRKHGYILLEPTMLYNNANEILIERWNAFAFSFFFSEDELVYI